MTTGLLSKQKNIPCIIQVSDEFEILFPTVIPYTKGIIQGWDRRLLEERVIARAGGVYTHNEPALITLHKQTEDSYRVIDLQIFYNDFGWCPVIKDGEYATPTQFWDCDDEDPEYIPED